MKSTAFLWSSSLGSRGAGDAEPDAGDAEPNAGDAEPDAGGFQDEDKSLEQKRNFPI
eukprot:CAMPEP_0181328822 /NCGR_PEP_ID=MMETSP1101-20121128/22950_1 /TAXON_ID=46948 /ORGANISM="Rhodomonas abbreviata, Strain Caron Lab Isolate" /LENGTH=56 /DNA_ID=CAMNT_0023437795 /DNA_START=117 /DNA_END=287 /DNA_ORIENTATION=+